MKDINKSIQKSKNDGWVYFAIVLCFLVFPRVIITSFNPDYFAKKFANDLAENMCFYKSKGLSNLEVGNKSLIELAKKHGAGKVKNANINKKLFLSTLEDKTAECGIDLSNQNLPDSFN